MATLAFSDNVAVTGFTFTATGTNTSADGFFQIDALGNITLTAAGAAGAANDFETGANSFVLNVTAVDAAGNPDTANITLNVTDLDEVAPVVNDQSFNYAENRAVGATVATLAFSDNVAVTGFTFTATGTNTSADGFFQIDALGNITLTAAGAAGAANDFETGANSFVLNVTAVDAAGNPDTANITLNVTDLDEVAPVVNDQSFNYAENRAVGATVATLAFSDNVAVTGFTFTATGTTPAPTGSSRSTPWATSPSPPPAPPARPMTSRPAPTASCSTSPRWTPPATPTPPTSP